MVETFVFLKSRWALLINIIKNIFDSKTIVTLTNSESFYGKTKKAFLIVWTSKPESWRIKK